MRNKSPISLIMMDIDFFKAYNDEYGHPAGDECLHRLAQALAECIRRPADLVARIGGEEFAGVLPETGIEGALIVAGQMRDRVNALNIPHAHSAAADRVTISLGAATAVPGVGQPAAELVQSADALLYRAKQSGRNRVESEADN
jgi:diguanylate cyclase (GGDEF)-like protein